MKAFAKEIALGTSKAEAYRRAYNSKPAPSTIVTAPYKLASDARIQREVEAYRLALEAEKHRTPVQLKALLVQQLVQHSLDEDFPPAQRMKALQLIGNLFEVGAFLERKESVIVHKSSDIRTRLLERLGKVSDVKVKQDDALTLLEEIRGDGTSKEASGAPTAPVAALADAVQTRDLTHTVSLIQSPEKTGVPPSKNPDEVSDFDIP
jgi:type III secretion system FlhB-like substrate exporter